MAYGYEQLVLFKIGDVDFELIARIKSLDKTL